MIPQIVGSVARAVLQTVGGAYVGQGYLTDDELSKGIGALIFLASLAWSIWQKSRSRTVAGGEFNPRAEVRKPAGYKFPKTGGSARWRALAMLAIFFVGGVLAGEVAWRAERFCEPVPAVRDGAITWAAPHDKRPYWQRLLGMLSVTPRVTVVTSADGGQTARITGSTVTVRGEF